MTTEQETRVPEKVCPYCGNDRFIWRRMVLQNVIVDGKMNLISEQDSKAIPFDNEDRVVRPECYNCTNVIPGFVDDDFFHEEICSEDYEDTVPAFIEPHIHKAFEARLGQAKSRIPLAPPSFTAGTSTYPWRLEVTMDTNEQGVYELHGTVLSNTGENGTTVRHDDIAVWHLEPVVTGRYVFDWEGKKYSVYVLKSDIDDVLIELNNKVSQGEY